MKNAETTEARHQTAKESGLDGVSPHQETTTYFFSYIATLTALDEKKTGPSRFIEDFLLFANYGETVRKNSRLFATALVSVKVREVPVALLVLPITGFQAPDAKRLVEPSTW